MYGYVCWLQCVTFVGRDFVTYSLHLLQHYRYQALKTLIVKRIAGLCTCNRKSWIPLRPVDAHATRCHGTFMVMYSCCSLESSCNALLWGFELGWMRSWLPVQVLNSPSLSCIGAPVPL